MSFYNNPWAQLQQQQYAQRPHVVHRPSPFAGYPFATGPAPTPAPQPQQFNFYANANQPAVDYNDVPGYPYQNYHHRTTETDIEEEERAALAHLRAIQRRKEAERIVREEAATRERLVAHHQRVQREREVALAIAQREREVALERARVDRARQLRAALEQEERARSQIRITQADIARKQAAFEHDARVRQHAINEQRRQHCARRHRIEQSRAQPPQAPSASAFDNEQLHQFIANIFGIHPDVTDDAPVPASTEAAPSEQPATSAPSAPSERSTETVAGSTAATDKPAETASTDKSTEQKEFPNAINDLLSNFLGLRVEPESKLGEAVANKVPEGLNELLGQFGLEFFPDEPKSKQEQAEAGPSKPKEKQVSFDGAAKSATEPAPAPQGEFSRPQHPFDLSEFLSGNHALPPFVRDILGNVELAFKDRQEEVKKDKGKGVAEGERKAKTTTPDTASSTTTTPAPAATAPAASAPVEVEVNEKDDSISKLESIASEIELAKEAFTFPSSLSFSTTNTTDKAPSLLFNKQNKPYHAQNNKLLQLLLQADGVASNGDKEVRRKRKEVVKLVEGEIEALERKRDEYWSEVKDRRDQTGEVSENESWATESTVDHDEPVHVEDVAAAESTDAPIPTLSETEAAAEPAQPPTFAEAVKSTDTTAPDPEVPAVEPVSEDKVEIKSQDVEAEPEAKTESKPEDKHEKEEGYELV